MSTDFNTQARAIVAEVKAELESEAVTAETLSKIEWTGALYWDSANETMWFELKMPGSWAGATWYNEDVRGGSLEPEDIARMRDMNV